MCASGRQGALVSLPDGILLDTFPSSAQEVHIQEHEGVASHAVSCFCLISAGHCMQLVHCILLPARAASCTRGQCFFWAAGNSIEVTVDGLFLPSAVCAYLCCASCVNSLSICSAPVEAPLVL